MHTKRKPIVKILLSGLLPRDQFPSKPHNIIDLINKELDLRCRNKNIQKIHFLSQRFTWTNQNGSLNASLYYTDFLHLSWKGTEKFSELIIETIKEPNYKHNDRTDITFTATADTVSTTTQAATIANIITTPTADTTDTDNTTTTTDTVTVTLTAHTSSTDNSILTETMTTTPADTMTTTATQTGITTITSTQMNTTTTTTTTPLTLPHKQTSRPPQQTLPLPPQRTTPLQQSQQISPDRHNHYHSYSRLDDYYRHYKY